MPDSGKVADRINILGSGFGQDTAEVQVTFNATKVTAIQSVSDTLLQVAVPSGATTGKVQLIVGQDTVYSEQEFRILTSSDTASVRVTAFSPSAGNVGDTLTITGTGFGESIDDVEVKLGEVETKVIEVSATQLQVIIPENAQTAKISVKVGEREASSEGEFEVIEPVVLQIKSLSASSGSVGDTLTITGEGFSTERAENEVKLGDVAMTVVTASATELKVTVPEEAKNGKITVTVGEQTSSSEEEFEVIAPVVKITSLSATDLVEGDTLVIEGEGFGASLTEIQVKVGDELAEIVEVSETMIRIIVPRGISSGRVSIEVGDQTVSSEETVTVREPSPVVITKIEPNVGILGTTVIITGEGFSGDDDENVVKFNGVTATITRATSTELIVTVPARAFTGKVTVTTLGATGTSDENFVVEGTWIQKGDLPFNGGYDNVAFAIGDKGYALDMSSGNNRLYQYDPSTNLWTQKSSFPGDRRQDMTTVVFNGKAYAGLGRVLGGVFRSYFDWWEYDPATNEWTQKTNCPISSGEGFAIGNKVYMQQIDTSRKRFYEYDPSTDTWTQKQDFAGEAYSSRPVIFTIGDKGYIATGSFSKKLWEYNPDNDSWVEKADLPGRGRSFAVGFTINGKGYVGSGAHGHADFWEYDPMIDTWKEKSSFTKGNRSSAFSFVVGNKGYVGSGASNRIVLDDFWEFTP
ncbi:MAG: IPT/TIG domain-containing protein [Bacteroidota bacterium]